MKKISFIRKYVLSRGPKEYLKQGFAHCGAFSVKAILSAYGKDTKKDPRDYHSNPINKFFGTAFYRNYWINVLGSYGLDAEAKSAKEFPLAEKINILKSVLSKDKPAMVYIGNGYLDNGNYSKIKAKFTPHWITLWGYDDSKQIFYVYDSCIPKDNYYPNIPVGNTTRSYDQMIRDWKGAMQIVNYDPYFYIEIKNELTRREGAVG